MFIFCYLFSVWFWVRLPWWHQDMDKLFTLLIFSAKNQSLTGRFPAQMASNSSHGIILMLRHPREHFLYTPSQWETTLHCNVAFHWLGAYTQNHPCTLMLTWLSKPIVRSIIKNMTAQSGEGGIRAMASGYAMNTRPGPGNGNMLPISCL